MNELVTTVDGYCNEWRSVGVDFLRQMQDSIQRRAVHLAVVLSVFLLFAVYGSVIHWTLGKFLLSGWHWHWGLAAVALGLAFKSGFPKLTPVMNLTACVLLLVSVLAHVVNQLTLDLTLVSALLFILSGQAVLGLVITPQRWRTMMWPVVVGCALLPLDFYLEPFLGYPLRLFSAKMANGVLQEFGVQAMTVQSIVMVDNRANVVDLDCSGINSLWAGGILYLMLSWLMGLAIGMRWFALGVFFIVLLLTANTIRIVALVLLDMHAMHAVAEVAHQSLGLVGFTLAFLLVWLLAEKIPRKASSNAVPAIKELRFVWPLLPLLVLLLVCFTVLLLYKEKPDAANSTVLAEPRIVMPVSMQAQTMKLDEVEQQYFEVTGARADKYALNHINASLVLVTSRWWKAHHVPDYCLQSQGYSIDNKVLWKLNSNVDQINPLTAVSMLHLTDADSNIYTAVYWFQSGEKTVADYSARVTDTLRNPSRRWTMVSMLFKGAVDESDLKSQIEAIHQAIAMSEGK